MSQGPGRLYQVAEQQRAALLRGERQAASELVRAYGGVWVRIQTALDTLLAAKYKAVAAGETVGVGWLFQFGRLESLQAQVEAELRRFVQIADPLITREQGAAVDAALAHTELLVRTLTDRAGVSVGWARLPTGAIEDLVGFTATGSPLRELLDALGPAASAAVRDALIQGVALGRNPTAIARGVRQAIGGNLARALTICRTEVLRSYREASLRSYQANSDVVDGWIWNCACTPRSCAMCWALHGSIHPLTERLDDHPNGRCSMLPVVKPLPGMSAQAPPESGPAQFARLDPAAQDAILGHAAGRAYRAGAIRLEDVVGRTFDPDWGFTRRVKSLREMVGKEEAKKWLKAPALEIPVQRTVQPLRFATVDEAVQWADDNYAQWKASLTDAELDDLKWYQSNGYKHINGALRTGVDLDDPDIEAAIENIDRALARTATPQDVIVYRGGGIDHWMQKGQFDRLDDLVGREFKEPGYSSFTLDQATGRRYYDRTKNEVIHSAIIEMHLPKGAAAGWMEAGGLLHLEEYEMLLPRGVEYRIIEVRRAADGTPTIIVELI